MACLHRTKPIFTGLNKIGRKSYLSGASLAILAFFFIISPSLWMKIGTLVIDKQYLQQSGKENTGNILIVEETN